MSDEDDPDGFDPGQKMLPIEVSSGSTSVSPHRDLAEGRVAWWFWPNAAGMADMFDPEGFHVTDTLDYVYVIDGPVELMLDDRFCGSASR